MQAVSPRPAIVGRVLYEGALKTVVDSIILWRKHYKREELNGLKGRLCQGRPPSKEDSVYSRFASKSSPKKLITEFLKQSLWYISIDSKGLWLSVRTTPALSR